MSNTPWILFPGSRLRKPHRKLRQDRKSWFPRQMSTFPNRARFYALQRPKCQSISQDISDLRWSCNMKTSFNKTFHAGSNSYSSNQPLKNVTCSFKFKTLWLGKLNMWKDLQDYISLKKSELLFLAMGFTRY